MAEGGSSLIPAREASDDNLLKNVETCLHLTYRSSDMTHCTLTVLGLMAVFVTSSYAIKCYYTGGGTIIDCSGSCKTTTTTTPTAETTNGCSSFKREDGCKIMNEPGVSGEICYCNTDFCNSSLRINSSHGLAIVLMAFAYLYKFL